jgi:hypothetical protein
MTAPCALNPCKKSLLVDEHPTTAASDDAIEAVTFFVEDEMAKAGS